MLATATSFAGVHAAPGAERIHIDFNGYRSATNDYCITATSVQGDAISGFLWRFTVGGGPSAAVAPTNFVNLLTATTDEMFPQSRAEHEKFRVYSNLLGPILGSKSISNEVNAFRTPACASPAPPDPTPPTPDPPIPTPTPRPSPSVDPDTHRQIARLLGTDFAARPDVIADAVLCGLRRQQGLAQQGLAGGVTHAAMTSDWCAWASPRQVNYSDDRSGLKFSGTLQDVAFGLHYRVRPDLVVGLAFLPQETNVSLDGLRVSFHQTGWGGGPYLGWQIRPTTIFDAWLGYQRLVRSFDVFGMTASAPVDRTFMTMNLTEFIDTPWMRVIPRITYFQAMDRAQTFETNNGFALLGASYEYSFVETSLELNRDTWVSALLLQPFVRATVRYDTQRIVDSLSTLDDAVLDLGRWHGQLRGGVRAQLGPQVQVSVSGGYLSLFTSGVKAWEARAFATVRF